MRVGVAGLGRMGAAIAERLLASGFEVAVWNRTPAKATPLCKLGATAMETPRALVAATDVVISMVRDDAAALELYLGGDGLCCAEAQGRVFIDMSTLQPATTRSLHACVRDHGGRMLDAPVSGTVAPAREGRLVALVGGDTEDIARAEPVLRVLTRRIIHAGQAGHGALLKLVINLPLGVYWHALAEALAMGEAGGLDRRLMLDALGDSAAALAVLGMKAPLIMGDSAEVAFDVSSMRKDLLTIIATAEALGSDTSSAETALAAYSAAEAAGIGGEDAVAIARPARR